MPRENNFLIGRGELLTSKVEVKSGGGAKNSPYSLGEARSRMNKWLHEANSQFDSLPESARPKGQVVATLTMHPRYISKSDFPVDLFKQVGLRAVGSKTQSIKPEKWGVQKHAEEALTETYFVAGQLESFKEWNENVNLWSPTSNASNILMQIEDLKAFRGIDKLKGIPEKKDEAVFEFVIHNDHDPEVIEAFYEYIYSYSGIPLIDKRRDVRGLTFLPVRASIDIIEELADFSFVRVARGMPTLRPFRPLTLRGVEGFKVELPEVNAISPDIKTVVFDGGISDPDMLKKWVNYIEPANIGLALPAYLEHGLAVTSSVLFGQLENNVKLNQPFSKVDHVRVLDVDSGRNDCDIIDVLDRIKDHLKKSDYEFVNISLGPNTCVDDDEVTLWTASIDEVLANGKTLVTVAAGNNGESDAASGLNRVQVPADAVNVLSVGAANSLSPIWNKACYSAVGPGRSPGRVKPDIVAFGGSDTEPFMVLTSNLRAEKQQGTSFAAPLVLRSTIAVRSILGSGLSVLALRALMIHRADADIYNMREVGWGRCEIDPTALITSDDDEAIVVYQGELPVGQHLRLPVPLQGIVLAGSVDLSATLVISPEVDPEYPGSYTRSGVEISFRPHDGRFATKNGKRSQHPISSTFFSESKMFGGSEYESKGGGHKWEPTLKHKERFKADKLSNPMFDIYYHHRLGGGKALDQKPIPYAIIISVKASSVPDLYNQMIRNYASILTPIRPVNRLQINLL